MIPDTVIERYAERTGQSPALVRSQIERTGAVYLGGRAWECARCAGPLTADCPCCAPPSCNCGRERRHVPQTGGATLGPWIVWHLADDPDTYGDRAGKPIITTADEETEVCGVVWSEDDARLIAEAPTMRLVMLRLLRGEPVSPLEVAAIVARIRGEEPRP